MRAIDIANYMGYSKASITHAVSVLKNSGFITVDHDHHIVLTDIGVEHAEKVFEKHEFFKKHLISIGVDEETAEKDACQIEHAISDLSFHKLKQEMCTETGKRCFECGNK